MLDIALSSIAHERYSLKFDSSAWETSTGEIFGDDVYDSSSNMSSNEAGMLLS